MAVSEKPQNGIEKMHELEPYYGWLENYNSNEDNCSPFFNFEYNLTQYTAEIYGYYIHPLWDYIGSETLYLKILYANYETKTIILEMFGEWNDALHNDIMHLKRNIIDHFILQGISKFILIGEYVFNFHGSDDCYYEEWFDDCEEGWIAAVNFREHVLEEWKKYGIGAFVNYGGSLIIENWRTLSPEDFAATISKQISFRIE